MGLLLSVLVMCVGVLEVIACVRHFQDGYLPLWTPHCALTSGYTKTHERWRNKPSDSYEFRSTNDVSGALNHAQDQSSETFLQPSPSVENGYTVKHEFQDTKKEVTPSEIQINDDALSSFKYENKIEDLHATDGISPALGTEGNNLELISTYDKELDIPIDEYDERKYISTNYSKPDLFSELVDKHPESIDSQFEVLLNTTESTVPISYHSEETKLHTSSNEDLFLGNCAEETSNILSEKHTISDVLQTSGEEIISHEISNKPETSRFEYEIERPVESIEELNNQIQSTKVSIFQKEVIPQSPANQVPLQNMQICESEVASSAPKESVGLDRISDENSELKTDFTSKSFESTEKDNCKIESIDERSYVTTSDTQTESEIPFNNFHKQNLEETSISKAKTNVPESEYGAFETQEGQNIDLENDYEQPGSVDVDEGSRHSRESTPQVYEEYVPLTSDQMKSEIPSELSYEDRLEDVNISNINPENQVQESQVTSETPIITETSIFESENQSQQELEEASKYDAVGSIHDNEENVYTQQDRESTPQPFLKEIEEIKKIETTLRLQEVESGHQSEISKHPPEPESQPAPVVIEREEGIKTIGIDTSESRLENQTTSTEFVVSKDEDTDKEPQVLVPKPEIPKEIDKHLAASPLTIDTSEESPPITRHPSHQSSMSPPQLPSTPTKKSKADISWPTFFPGAPVIKRPSVSFATPEAVFTNEDQELLRQYAEEASDITPCIKKSEETRSVADVEEKTPSATDDKSLETLEASERSDSFDEDVVPVTFKERSPSNIVAGNDFSRKELQLQRRKSYKHKRYSSATELNTREEEAEDRSFSENKSGIVRASSLKESRRRYRKPAKASSFEDAMLLETSKTREKESTVTRTGDASSIPVIEEKEVESQRGRVVSFEEESEKEGDHQKESNQRNESNASKIHCERRKEETKAEPDPRKEEEDQEESSSYSVSEDQSSSQQKSPANEAFWVSRGDDESD